MISISIFLISTILACCYGGEKVKECTQPGLFCENSTSLVRCLRNSNDDGWQKIHVATCDKSAPCVRDQCTADDIVYSFCNGTSDLKFVCHAPGIFPDPCYCNKYVMCIPLLDGKLQAHRIECPPFTQYDYKTGLCNIELPNNQCESGVYPVPLCEEQGQNGPLPGRESVYYICEQHYTYGFRAVLYPSFYVCSGTKIYQKDYGCY